MNKAHNYRLIKNCISCIHCSADSDENKPFSTGAIVLRCPKQGVFPNSDYQPDTIGSVVQAGYICDEYYTAY